MDIFNKPLLVEKQMEATNGKMVINPEVILNDITKNAGYVLLEDEDIVGYVALLINDDEYEILKEMVDQQ
jgi:hypothetical protein